VEYNYCDASVTVVNQLGQPVSWPVSFLQDSDDNGISVTLSPGLGDAGTDNLMVGWCFPYRYTEVDVETACEIGSTPLTVNSPATPYVTGVTPPDIFPGTSGTITVTGWGFTGATVTIGGTGVNQTDLPRITDSEIDLDYSVGWGAAPGPTTITITTAWGSTTTSVTVVSPCHMIVQSDITDYCPVCQRNIARWVKYLVVGSDKQTSVSHTLPNCESVTRTWNSTTIPDPGLSFDACGTVDAYGNVYQTNQDGTFTDMWSLYSDKYSAGVGYDDEVDTWYGYGGVNKWIPIGVLRGYLHSDAIQINGVKSTYPNKQQMQKGTVMPEGCSP
jgi:predicted Fe-S protein YdhL (DUF1289 family)